MRARMSSCQRKALHHDSTNFAFVLFQQVSMLQSWWAQGEARWKKGLTQQVFIQHRTASNRVPCRSWHGRQAAGFPSATFEAHCSQLWCWPASLESPWTLSPCCPQAHSWRRVQSAASLRKSVCLVMVEAFTPMLEKVPYWLCHESFTNEVLQRACCGGGLQQQTALPEISELSAKLALEFIHLPPCQGLSCL